MNIQLIRRVGFGVGPLLASGWPQAADPAVTGADPSPEQALTIAVAKLPTGAKPVELVLIPAGSFRMGCELTERGRFGREFHPDEVTITRPFYFGNTRLPRHSGGRSWAPALRGPTERGMITGTLRVMRGGAWESHALHLRSADRSPVAPDGKEYGRLIGFRLVREWP